MLPLSLGRTAPRGHTSRELHRPFGWLRPANNAAASSVEVRALVTWLVLFAIASVTIELAHVWLRLKVTDLGYRLSTTQRVIQKLQSEGHELTAEVARLNASDRLEEVARVRLGMARPQRGQEVVLP